jgi:hypothetical protein
VAIVGNFADSTKGKIMNNRCIHGGTFNRLETWADYMEFLCINSEIEKIPFSWITGSYFL